MHDTTDTSNILNTFMISYTYTELVSVIGYIVRDFFLISPINFLSSLLLSIDSLLPRLHCIAFSIYTKVNLKIHNNSYQVSTIIIILK